MIHVILQVTHLNFMPLKQISSHRRFTILFLFLFRKMLLLFIFCFWQLFLKFKSVLFSPTCLPPKSALSIKIKMSSVCVCVIKPLTVCVCVCVCNNKMNPKWHCNAFAESNLNNYRQVRQHEVPPTAALSSNRNAFDSQVGGD